MTVTDEIRSIATLLENGDMPHLAHQLRLLSLDVANMEKVLLEQHTASERSRLIAALMLETAREQRDAAITASENVVILSTHRAARTATREAVL